MTSLELLQEIDAWFSFNNSPSKEQIGELRNDIKKHISEQLNILHVSNPLPVVRLSMEEILRDAVRRQATYQAQFADYDLDTWTAPCQLTENRMEKLLADGSIRKVRLELEM